MLNKEQTDFLLVNAYNAAVRAGARIIDIYTVSYTHLRAHET